MKFNEICKQLFIMEQDEIRLTKKQIADPNDFNDVEPLPAPQAQDEVGVQKAASVGSTLQQHVDKLEEFVEFLNGTEEESLQSFLNKLDIHSTPFEGISDNGQIKSAILSTVKSANDIVAVFNQYINVAKG
jgi:hypothetical protein